MMASRVAVIALLVAGAVSLRLQSAADSEEHETLAAHAGTAASVNVAARARSAELEAKLGKHAAKVLTDFEQQAATDAMQRLAKVPTPEEAERAEKAQPALKGCMSDEGTKLNDMGHFNWRKSILQWVQPWKYEEETLRKYQEDPKIKKIYYINNDDGRANFMENSLKWVDHIPHEKITGVTRESVEAMQVNGGVPQACWGFSSQGIAPYLTGQPYDNVIGSIAVYLSHANLFVKLAQEDGNSTDIYAIMEDDAGLNANWDSQLLEAVKTLPPDWDIARFVYWGGKRCQDAVPYFHENQTKTSWYEARGSDTQDGVPVYAGNQAYLIRPKSVPYVLDVLRNMPVMDIDGNLGSNHQESQKEIDGKTISINWGLHTYNLETPLGVHKVLGTKRLNTQENTYQQNYGDGTRKQRVPTLPWPLNPNR